MRICSGISGWSDIGAIVSDLRIPIVRGGAGVFHFRPDRPPNTLEGSSLRGLPRFLRVQPFRMAQAFSIADGRRRFFMAASTSCRAADFEYGSILLFMSFGINRIYRLRQVEHVSRREIRDLHRSGVYAASY